MRGAVSTPAGFKTALVAAAVAVGLPGSVVAQSPCPAAPPETAFRNLVAAAPPLGSDKRLGLVDDGGRWSVLDSVWNHRTAVERGLLQPLAAAGTTADNGEIAVLQDAGDLFRASNVYDLRDVTLRFAANDDGGYDVTHLGVAAWRSPLGGALTLGDDDSAALALSFDFPFYAATHASAFVNSDGNLTFEEGDSASTARVALFLSDLDPSAGGGVYSQSGADAVTVTWCDVPGFESQSTTTVQVSLLATGAIEMTFDPDVGLGDAIVGLSPGRTTAFESVDLSAPVGAAGGAAAVGERFALRGELDTVAVAQKFLLSHPDAYDQILIWTDWPVLFDAFAYEVTIGNRIEGIGQAIYDIPADFGSETLTSIVVMGWLGKYSDDPDKKVNGENTTLSLLGHETGHRWLALMEFSDHDRERSSALLGRQQAHWSFFFDSDASVMEGNDIEDLGGGSFRTVAAVEGYSALDQYAMGLRHDHEVPAFFYVEAPTNAMPPARSTQSPQVGVTFNGTRREVLIADVIEVEGARVPNADESPRVHRQAFVYVVGNGREANPDQVARLDTIRGQWEPFFAAATDDRMRVETRLRPQAPTRTTDP